MGGTNGLGKVARRCLRRATDFFDRWSLSRTTHYEIVFRLLSRCGVEMSSYIGRVYVRGYFTSFAGACHRPTNS